MLKFTLWVLFSLFAIEKIFAQTKQIPLRLEEKTSKKEARNSKLGEHTVKKKYFELIYRDSTKEILSQDRLKEIIKDIPESKIGWQKYKVNNLYKMSSLPFLATGFVGAVNYINGSIHKKRDAVIGVLGLVSAVTIFNYFDHKAQRNKTKMILYYNRHWSLDAPKKEFEDIISPDMIRLGAVDNSFGVGFSWFLDKKY